MTIVTAFLLSLLIPPGILAQSHTDSVERAATLIQENRIEEAERELNQALKVRPNDAAALNLQGAIRALQGKLGDAEDFFTRAVRIDNRLVGAHLNLARLYLLKGALEKTIAELKEALRLEPGNAEAGYRMAWSLLSLGRFDECISLVEHAKQTLRPSAPMLAVLGDAYIKKGAVNKAESSYLSALNAEGAKDDALLGLAAVAQARGDNKTAAEYLNRASDRFTDSPDLLYKFALIALDLQLNGEAMLALKRAGELRPDEPSYRFLSGVAWLRKPDLQEAELAFREFIRLRPDHAQGQMYLGYSLLKQKKYDEAREWLEKSAGNDAGAPETFYYMGLLAQEQNDNERAVELFEKAIRLSPSFANAHVALGATYLKMKNYLRARVELEAGAKLTPDDSKAHYNLARLYTLMKDPQRAQEEMKILERLKNSGGQTAESDAVTPPSPRPRRQEQ
jgi:tetratricopeptide (TPR) repeat protein